MKTLALITQKFNSDAAQWQFDKVMAAIAYDCELSVVFIGQGIEQLKHNKAWKSLEIYGINDVYTLTNDNQDMNKALISCKTLNQHQLKQLITCAQLIL
jgi:sulfur relay (sulfurtransferase) DsrF/TusC family protein